MNFANTNVSMDVIEKSVFVGAAMIEKYGKGLLKVMLGEGTPEKCVEECEKNNEEDSE